MIYLTFSHTPIKTIEHELFDLSFCIKANNFEDAYRSKFFWEKAENFIGSQMKKEENCQKFLKKNDLDAFKGSDGYVYFWDRDNDLDYIKDLIDRKQKHFFDVSCIQTFDDGSLDHYQIELFHCKRLGPIEVGMIVKIVDPHYSSEKVFIDNNGIVPKQTF